MTCKDGTTNGGYYLSHNKYGLFKRCPNYRRALTRTITAGSAAAEVTFQAKVDDDVAATSGAQMKVFRETTRRLGDQCRLASTEDLTKGGWAVKLETAAEAPADSGARASSGSSSDNASHNKTGTTAAIAIGATALVVGAIALVTLRAGRQQPGGGSGSELELALATDEAGAGL